jgi:hypothetical protein
MTPKGIWQEQAKRLREAAALNDPIAREAVALVQSFCDYQKESLVDAEGEDMLRVQGAVRSLKKLHRELTETPPQPVQEQL